MTSQVIGLLMSGAIAAASPPEPASDGTEAQPAAPDDPDTAAPDGPLHVRTCARAPVSVADDVDALLDSVLLVQSPHGQGTGFWISNDGYILTAAHVVGQAETVQLRNRSGKSFEAVVVRVDDALDVAVLYVADATETCLVPHDSAARTGQAVYSVGSPLGEALAFSFTRGVASSYRGDDAGALLQLSMSLSPGYSGGPVVDDDGKVLGIVSWKVVGPGVEGIAFAVPIDRAIEGLDIELGDRSDTDPPRRSVPEPVTSPTAPPPRPEPEQSASVGPRQSPTIHEVPAAELRRRRAARIRTAGISLSAIGAGAAVPGTSLWVVGQASERRNIRDGGIATVVVSGALLATGIALVVWGSSLAKKPAGRGKVKANFSKK